MAETWDGLLDQEHRLIEKVLGALEKNVVKAQGAQLDFSLASKALDFLVNFADKCHHAKEEKVLFPLLEERGIPREGGPIGVMLTDHEQGRKLLQQMKTSVAKEDRAGLKEAAAQYIEVLKSHIWKEDDVLYAEARALLSRQDGRQLVVAFERIEEEEAGHGVHEKYEALAKEIEEQAGGLPPLIRDLPIELVDAMLDTLPVEITLVDSEDTVRYFNGERRAKLFSRTRAIIGRKVQQCHPEKSVHLVNRILDDFKSGRKDVAEFWLDQGRRKIHIRYFAVRDIAGKYLGCAEMVQDITDIKALEGEKRLL